MEEFKLEPGWLAKQMDEAQDWLDSYTWYQVMEVLDLASMEVESKSTLNLIEEIRQKAYKKFKEAKRVETNFKVLF